jgi:hypothetical protein
MTKTCRGAIVLALACGCYNAGPYGYDRVYAPLRPERAYLERAQEAVYNDVRSDPADFQGQVVSWFGEVESVAPAEGGGQQVRMGFRAHQERHLCEEAERQTCRVTVAQASSGSFTAVIQLTDVDQHGRNRVAAGSLLRVYCSVTGEYDAEGGPLLRCEYYRHWPRGQWVHTGMRGQMRR